MKYRISLFLLLIVFSSSQSQNPGGVTGSVLWLDANSSADNSSWNDVSGLGNSFTQATPANRPILNYPVFNFNAGFTFNGSSAFFANANPTNFPTGTDSRTIFAVANSGSTTGYSWILTYGNLNPGNTFTPDGTCQLGNLNGGLANAFFASANDMSEPSVWSNSQNTNGALVCFSMASASNTQTLRNKGIDLVSQTYNNALSAASANAFVGRLDVYGEYWNGSMSEIIVFNSDLSSADKNKVESYLALKYGLSLGSTTTPVSYTASNGTVFWSADATYQNDVFGIGVDNGSALLQIQSNSSNSGSGDGSGQNAKGNLVLVAASPIANNQFLMIGNDGGSLNESTIITGQAPTIAEGGKRVSRNWRVQNTGSVGAVDLSFDATGFTYGGGATLSEYRLMIDEDGDANYTTGTQTFITPTSSSGNLLQFSGITFPNNAVFTIITQAAGSALPATWNAFTANIKNSSSILLNWVTTSESAVEYYSIQHSYDGINFSTIGKVDARNESANSYSFVDGNLSSGKHFYRVKQVDKNGKTQLSAIRFINIFGKAGIFVQSNPVQNNQLMLSVNLQQAASVTVRVITLEGKLVSVRSGHFLSGNNNLTIDVSGLASGTYIVQSVMNGKMYTIPFVRQ